MSKKQKRGVQNEQLRPNGWSRPIPGWLSPLLISVVGVLIYSNTLGSSFHFDDESSITANTAIKNLADLRAIWSFSPARFITYLSFAVNYHFGGLNVLGYHIISILIHIAAALTVWQLALRLFRTPAFEQGGILRKAPLLALGAGLIFVAHPIQTQAVTYIAQRAASLATLFYALSLTFFISARIAQIQDRNRLHFIVPYVLSGATGLLALFSKETAFTLPFAMILVEFFFLQTERKVNWKFAGGALVLFSLALIALVRFNLISLVDTTDVSRQEYLFTQFRVVLSYVQLLIVPVGQSVDHFVAASSGLFEAKTFLSLVVLVLLVLLALWLFPRNRMLSFGIFWFFLTLLPESSIIPIKDYMFEHRLYLPMIGVALSIVSLVDLVIGGRTADRFVIALVCYIALLGWLAFERNSVWKDDITLWTDVIDKTPMNPRAYHNRGRAFADRDRVNEALSDYNIAIALAPDLGPPHNNRATLYIRKGMVNEAISDCTEALRIGDVMDYQTARTYFNRGTAYLMKNRLDSAAVDFGQAVVYDPSYSMAYFNLGLLAELRGDTQKAIVNYSRCVALNPQNASALNSLGVIYKRRSQPDSALTHFSRAIAVNPAYPQSYLNRGLMLNEKGEYDRAVADFLAFLKLSPNSFDGHYNLGLAYDRKGDFQNAVNELSLALKFNPSYAPALLARASAHAKAGQIGAAEDDLKRARDLGASPDSALLQLVKRGKK